jgi:GcrA cell cycle regulator
MSAVHSKETIASIAKYAENGLSASQIAAVIGNMTRNAVIGLAGRNKIPLHGVAKPREPRKPVAKPPYMQCEPVAEDAVESPRTDLITFEQLGPNTCRFPFGDRDYLFCGRPKFEDLPYCARCARRAFQPPRS